MTKLFDAFDVWLATPVVFGLDRFAVSLVLAVVWIMAVCWVVVAIRDWRNRRWYG